MESNPVYTVDWLSDVEIPLANKFYRKHAFRGKAKRHELCAVVRNGQQTIIASAYLRQVESLKLLAGVAVAQEYQGDGVARLLLKHMSGRFDHQTYTFPYEPLVSFYASLGFGTVNSTEQLPNPIDDLYHAYRKQGRAIAIMQYNL